MPDLPSISVPDWGLVALQILVIVVAAVAGFLLARRLVRQVFRALLDREAREGRARDLSEAELRRRLDTLDSLGTRVLQFFIAIVAGLMILGRLGIDIGPAIAGLGVFGIALGLGAQPLVRDYLTGALILIENQYAVGDVVQIAGLEGTVEDLTLRRTTLRDAAGNVHTVPHNAVTVSSNLTRGFAVFSELLLVPSADLVAPAAEVVQSVGSELAADPAWTALVLEPARVERIETFGPSGITLRIAARVVAGRRDAFAGELRRRLLAAFRERNLPLVPSAADGDTPPG